MELDPRFPPSLHCFAPTTSASWSKRLRGGVKGSTVISTGSAWLEELQTLRVLHLALTPGHCSHTLHPASKYVLHCQMEMRAEF